MQLSPRFDARIAPLTLSAKDIPEPQTVFHDKSANVRAERIHGVVHLYGFDDITARTWISAGNVDPTAFVDPMVPISVAPGGELVYDNVAVRTVTHFPTTFTPKVIAAV
jgi:hypothetical protein